MPRRNNSQLIARQKKNVARRLKIPQTQVKSGTLQQQSRQRPSTNISRTMVPGTTVRIGNPTTRYVDRYSGEAVYERRPKNTADNLEKALKKAGSAGKKYKPPRGVRSVKPKSY